MVITPRYIPPARYAWACVAAAFIVCAIALMYFSARLTPPSSYDELVAYYAAADGYRSLAPENLPWMATLPPPLHVQPAPDARANMHVRHRYRAQMSRAMMLEAGRRAAGLKVLFAGVAHNCEAALPRVIQAINQTAARFLDYRVFIYENDSRDRTANVLLEWSKIDMHVDVEAATLKRASALDADRYRYLSHYRNHYIDWAMNPRFADYDYLIVVDMDMANGFDPEHVLSSLVPTLNVKGWDVACANGIIDSDFATYDLLALRSVEQPLSPRPVENHGVGGERWWGALPAHARHIYRPGDDWVPVWSCFGGMSVIRLAALRQSKCKYNGDHDCEHVGLYDCLRSRVGDGRFFINPNMVMRYFPDADGVLTSVEARQRTLMSQA